ncbi:MAG: flagellar basal body L-ring protein FlgH [Gemmataceae bacterium]
MSRLALYLSFAAVVFPVSIARADSIWDRRDPYLSSMLEDYRARRPGDLLTLVVSENTNFEGQEKRNMNKETKTNALFAFNGTSTGNSGITRSFTNSLAGTANSARKFDGTSNSTIDRKFTDTMTVMVTGVMPNGNLIIEGVRQRVVGRELRTLRIQGIVRPADVGPFNTVQSQSVGNFRVSYEGAGPDSNFTNQGWGGQIMNYIWPF